MKISELAVYGINVKGKHADLYSKRYYGVARDIHEAMNLVIEKAIEDGWSDVYIDDVTRFDFVSFATWLSEDCENDESEV